MKEEKLRIDFLEKQRLRQEKIKAREEDEKLKIIQKRKVEEERKLTGSKD